MSYSQLIGVISTARLPIKLAKSGNETEHLGKAMTITIHRKSNCSVLNKDAVPGHMLQRLSWNVLFP